jgi:hypothetical protein
MHELVEGKGSLKVFPNFLLQICLDQMYLCHIMGHYCSANCLLAQ